MNTLKNFLRPVRKPNTKFVLSDAFVDEAGNPLEWEMRQLGAKEGVEIAKATEELTGIESLPHYVAASLVTPNLKAKEVVDDYAEKHKGKIGSPVEILLDLVTDGEMAKLINIYLDHSKATTNFAKLVEEAKN